MCPLAVGSAVAPSGLPAGPLVLWFYKVDCPTCALVTPVLNRLHEAYPVPLIGVAQSDADEVSSFAAIHGLRFEQRIDEPPYPISRHFDVNFTPTLFLLSGDDKIADVVEAWNRPAWNELARRLAEVLVHPFVPLSTEADGLPASRLG